MSIFDGLFSDNPNDAAYLALASGLLGGKGSFNSILGNSLAGAQGAYSGAADSQMKRQLMKAQMGDITAQEELRKQQAKKYEDTMSLLKNVLGGSGAPNQYGAAGSGISLGGVQEPMIPSKGGLSGANPEQIAMLKAGGVDIEGLYNKAQFGEAMQPGYRRSYGGGMDFMPDPTKGIDYNLRTKQVSNLPGALEAQAAVTESTAGAQKKGEAPYQLTTYLDEKNQTRQKPLSMVLDEIRSSLANRPSGDSSGGTVTDKSIMGRFGDTSANFDIGGKQWSQLAGPQATTATGGQGIKTAMSPQEQSVVKATDELNKNWIDNSYTSALKEGQLATAALDGIQSARYGLKIVGKTGWSTDLQVSAARVLGALGVEGADKFATGAQVFNQAASTKLWQILNEAKGVQTEGDAERARSTYAQLKNTTKANEFILDLAEAVAQRAKAKQTFYAEGMPLAKSEGDLTQVDRKWNQYMPSVWEMPSMTKWKK
jgi:hypothetical protein